MLLKKLLIIVFLFSLVFNPDNKNKEERAYFYFYKGKVARQAGNLNSATNNYIRAVKYDPSNTDYILALVQVYFESREFEKAQNVLKTNQNSFKNETEVFLLEFVHGISLACHGEHEKAYNKFKQAERLSINLIEKDSSILSHLYNNLGCEKILDQPVEWTPTIEEYPHLTISFRVFPIALVYFREALKYNPDNEIALNNLNFAKTFCDFSEENLTIKNILYTANSPIPIIQKNNENNSKPNIKQDFNIKYVPDKTGQILKILNGYNEIILLLDISDSMDTELEIKNETSTRFDVMIDLAKYIVANVNGNVKLGGITVGSDCESNPVISFKSGSLSRKDLITRIDSLKIGGLTPLNSILDYSIDLFSDTIAKKAILLCTDGLNSCGDGNTCEISEYLYNQGINIYILSFLMEQNNQEEYSVFDCVANISEGEIYEINAGTEIKNKTIMFEPPYYSLLIPSDNIDTSYCLQYPRLRCTIPCNPTFQINN